MNLLAYGARTDVGKIRSHNEDCYRCEPELGLWIVADGMGGHQGGEVASALASDIIVQGIKEGKPLVRPIKEAHKAILEASSRGQGPQGMGTTVVAAIVKNNHYQIAWVGDCRAYIFNEDGLVQITRDHSYVQYLLDHGIIEKDEAENHAHQNFIMQALGAVDADDVEVGYISDRFYRGEQILLCSDGLNKEVTDEQIAEILQKDISEQEKTDILVDMAVENGGTDNITVVLISAAKDAPIKRPLLAKIEKRIKKIYSGIMKLFWR